jgi:iron complex outermembrane receptor protein
MRRALLATTITLLATLCPAVARAQAASRKAQTEEFDLVKLLNVEVSSATKTSESLDEAPASVTVVTREEIQRWGYRTVGEVLSHCVGFYVVDDHITPNVGVRGMIGGLGAESGVIKVMIDGRSVAYRTTSGNWLDAELVPLESVKQIEIVRGPVSALYGADAFLGVVNIITEAPEAVRPLQFRYFGGFSGANFSQQLDAVGGGVKGRFDYLVGFVGEIGSRSGLALPPESPSPNLPSWVGTRTTANNLDRRSLGLQARFGYRVPETGHFVVSVYASGFQRGGDFAQWAQLTNGTDALGRKVGTVISEAQLRVNADGLVHVTRSVDIAAQATYFQGGILPADRIEVGSDLWYARRRSAYQGVDANVEMRYVASKRVNIIVGLEGILDHEALPTPERIERATGTAVLATGSNDHLVNLWNMGAFVSANTQVVPQWLKLTTGVRYDGNSIYGNQLSLRAAAVSRWSKTLVAKLMYGNAFKAPSPYLLYASPLAPGDVEGNVNLKPQHVHTVEYQMSWKPLRFFGVTSGVSYNWLLQEAEFSPQGINQIARNTASQDTLAWELRADVKHYDDVAGYFSAEATRSRRDLGQIGYAANLIGTATPVYPRYILRAGVSAAIPSPVSFPLSVGAEGSVVGPRHAADTSVLAAGAQFDLPAYGLLNLFVTTRSVYLVRGHESKIALRVYNVLGTRGPDPGFAGFEYPLTGREIFLELRHAL